MKKILLGIMALMLSVMTVWAERVSESDAALVADHFMNVTSTASANRAPGKRMKMQKAATAPEAQYYIYENADGEGWVIIAANDVVRPILAYSETGHFRTDNMPSNVKGWLQSYDKQIQYVAHNTSEAPADVKHQWANLRKGTRQTKATVVVSPLIKTGWDQGSPYWNLCPQKSAGRCYTGCVATAMAQVMNYWKWPKQGIGSHTIPGTSYSANFGETSYAWENMRNKYSTGSPTNNQKTAVATLMYHCGVAVDMSYGTADEGGSAAYTIDYNGYFSSRGTMCAETALKQFFGYNSETIKGYYRDGYSYYGLKKWSRSEWIAMLKEELDAKRPIMYAGCGIEDNETYGHSFICDGYDSDSYFHFNWGWDNWCDGYYDVDALNTTDPGSGGGNGEYNLQQDVIVGIEPPIQGHAVVTNATGCSIACESLAENNKVFTATITPTDDTYDFTSLTVKLGNTTLTSSTHYTLSDDKKTLTILASAITGDVSNNLTITAVWTKNRYTYEMLGDNCTPDEAGGMLDKNAALNLTITPASGYTLAFAECWDVEMGGAALTFGTDYTYNTGNGEFQITSVTGDVEILVYGAKQITWISLGEVFAINITADDKLVLPDTYPTPCEGKVFMGWTATANYSSETTAPTFVKAGDDATETTYYAVYATEEGQGSVTKMIYLDADSVSSSYGTDTELTRCGITCYYTNIMKSSSSPSQIQMKKSGSYIANKDAITKIDSIIIDGTDDLTVYAGTSAKPSSTTITRDGKKYDFTEGIYSYFKIMNNNGNARYADFIKVYYSVGGSSYTDYTTSCVPPTKYTITINETTNGSVATDPASEAAAGKTVTITATPAEHYHLATLTVKDAENADVALSGTGNTRTFTMPEKAVTISATFEEDTKYTVRFINAGEEVSSASYYLGQTAETPADPTPECEAYTFVGWWTAELAADNTTAQTWITDFTVTGAQDYYAIYSKTEVIEGSGYDVTFTPGTDNSTSLSLTKNNVTMTVTDGDLNRNDNYRCYANNTMTISATSAMSKIVMTCNESGTTKGGPGNFSASGYSYSGTIGTWEGNATSVSFSASKQVQINLMVVTIGSSATSTTYYSSVVTCSTTDCEQVKTVEKAQKVLYNGQIMIIRGKDKYTIFGQKIQ